MKYEQALKQIPATGTGCHSALLGVANLGVMAGLSEHDLMQDIRAAIPTGGNRRVNDREILDAIHKAQSEVTPTQAGERRTYQKPEPKAAPFDGMAYRQKLIERSAGCAEADIWERSPYRLTRDAGAGDAVTVLEALYMPSEFLFVGELHHKQVCTVQRILERFKRGSDVPPHIIPNPMTGEAVELADGKHSFRCDATVSQYRFAVAEFDNMTKPDQVAFWHSIIAGNLMDVAALIDSGGKSLHAWLRVELPDADAWECQVRDGLYHPEAGRMTLMGADRACRNQSRLSRMPGHKRGDQWQRLLYINPELPDRLFDGIVPEVTI